VISYCNKSSNRYLELLQLNKLITIEHHSKTHEFSSLEEAMAWAKELGEFVTIKFNDLEIAGKFGVDDISSGKFPNGDPYTWKKRRRQ